MKAGYTNHNNLPERYNTGFSHLSDFRKVTSIEFAMKNVGFYQCSIDFTAAPKQVVKVLNNGQKYQYIATNIIRYLVDKSVKVQVFCGIYGKYTKQIEYEDYCFDEHMQRKAYSKINR